MKIEWEKVYKEKPLFLCISGSHLYGFPDENSDYDIRGAHIEPLKELLSLSGYTETYGLHKEYNDKVYDVETHEVTKLLHLMLKPNGNILEQLFAPPELRLFVDNRYWTKLMYIAEGCISKKLFYHYDGFATHMIGHIRKSESKRHGKDVEYAFRVLLTGINVLRTGVIEHNLERLLEKCGLEINKTNPFPELIDLQAIIRNAFTNSKLPDKPNQHIKEQANMLLLQIREDQMKNETLI